MLWALGILLILYQFIIDVEILYTFQQISRKNDLSAYFLRHNY